MLTRMIFGTLLAVGVSTVDAANAQIRDAAACGALMELPLEKARVVSAELIEGSETAPVHCALKGEAVPGPGSKIGFEIWMPLGGWTGRLQMIGNGGYGSTINRDLMARNLARGSVSLATDTGHEGDDPIFAKDRPVAIDDWGRRAVHVSVVHGKALVEAFYGRAAEYSYFAGCSTGGHQAFSEAQRYPGDFDGILAGAPGHNRTHLNMGFLWQFIQNHEKGQNDRAILDPDALRLANEAVLKACRAQNGAVSGGLPDDPYLNDPLACDFDPGMLACDEDTRDNCLNAAQVKALRAMYDGTRNPRTGERIYFGFTRGSEAAKGFHPALPGWSLYWADPADQSAPARANFWRYWVFGDPDWDWWDFDFDKDAAHTDEKLAARINAMDADLLDFAARGGKLLHYHGMNDPVVPVADSVHYHERVVAEVGSRAGAAQFYRLFLAPGMEHCWGGPGPFVLDLQEALEAWVEKGTAPERVMATRYEGGAPGGEVAYTRPLCPYPEQAHYSGNGDRTRAENFSCANPGGRKKVPSVGADYQR